MHFELSESERRVAGLIFRREAMTQAQIAAETGLTQQSSSRIVGRLSECGLLLENERVATGRRGYPSTAFRLNPAAAHAIGFALKHRSGVMVLVDMAGNVLAERRIALDVMRRDAVTSWLREQIDAVVEHNLGGQRATLAGLGVAVAGSHISPDVRSGYNTPHDLEEWAGIDIAQTLSGALGLPVWSDNNGNLAALAEAKIGVGRWARSFAYLYIGSGVGGGVILDGELWRGVNGNAGEFAGGLMPNVYPFPNLELLRQLVVRGGAPIDSVAELVERFDPAWPAIDGWIARVRDSLSIIASNATAILDVDAIVLGGEIPRDLAVRAIGSIELFDQRRRLIPRPMAKIVPAEAPCDPAALGAAVLPLQQCYF
jgi:predicted NBD/HSP70 family sugar kinase